MNVHEAILTRRSIKRFAERAVAPADLERLLEAAVLAPNHRMTQPWRFLVLGPEARRVYGRVLGSRKAAKVTDPAAAELVARNIEEDYAGLPAMIGVAMHVEGKPEDREEDYAATYMALENLLLQAVELGLGTHVKTGAVMDDPRVRHAFQLPDDERLVAIVQVGYPLEQPQPKPRRPAAELTRWLP